MSSVAVLFPHQLFKDHPIFEHCEAVWLVEETLFFKQYNFHKQKLAFHRASMKCYADYLIAKGIKVNYVDANAKEADVRVLISTFKNVELHYIDPVDYLLQRRIARLARQMKLKLVKHDTLLFINREDELQQYFENKKRFFQTDFYNHERVKRKILIQSDGQPEGGKWSFDEDNRLRYPKGKQPPYVSFPEVNSYYEEARFYVNKNFADNYGELDKNFHYPINFEESERWLEDFFSSRFYAFGEYEDAIVSNEHILHHGLLSPLINTGLLSAKDVLKKTLVFAVKEKIALNTVEGFVRQLIGWREFMRAVYLYKGVEERTKNYWGFTRKIPPSFWSGDTGIEPVDQTIKKVLRTGYCHHIERLMVMGNFMLLCEFDPDDVYKWFMELFIDAYDWVMVPNVYGMSQFADGGLMSTKPYISASNYLIKMSDYKKGDWQQTWDGLFWRFMDVHRDFFQKNPRIGMLVKSFDKMDTDKRTMHHKNADRYLQQLDKENSRSEYAK